METKRMETKRREDEEDGEGGGGTRAAEKVWQGNGTTTTQRHAPKEAAGEARAPVIGTCGGDIGGILRRAAVCRARQHATRHVIIFHRRSSTKPIVSRHKESFL